MLFTAGQFAKLHNINKRTLHYYDETGLFRPVFKGENGYRYYSHEQSPTLEMLLAMRELGMSIEEVKGYMADRSVSSLKKLLRERQEEIDSTIARLSALKSALSKKESDLDLSLCADESISVTECEEEYLLLSPLEGAEDDKKAFDIFLNHLTVSRELSSLRKSCGSMISTKKLMDGDFDSYDYLFTVIDEKSEKLFVRPKGKYIRAFCIGGWDRLPAVYKKITEFAEKNSLVLGEYAYENGLNDMAVNDTDGYVTQIMIGCENK